MMSGSNFETRSCKHGFRLLNKNVVDLFILFHLLYIDFSRFVFYKTLLPRRVDNNGGINHA